MKQASYGKKINQKMDYVPFLDWYFKHVKKMDSLNNIIVYIEENKLRTQRMRSKKITYKVLGGIIAHYAPIHHFKSAKIYVYKKQVTMWMLRKEYDRMMNQKQYVREKAVEILREHGDWMDRFELINRIEPDLQGKFSLSPHRLDGLLRSNTEIEHWHGYRAGGYRSEYRLKTEMGAK